MAVIEVEHLVKQFQSVKKEKGKGTEGLGESIV